MATPMMPHMVEVETVTRISAELDALPVPLALKVVM